MNANSLPEPRPSARVLVPALVVGWAIIGFGIHSALRDSTDANPFALLVHVVSFDLAHDLVIAPLAVGVGWLVSKWVPRVARGPVRAALAATVLYSAFAYPLVRRWGRRPTNSSTLPLPYGRNLAIVLVAVWAVAGTVILIRMRSRTGSDADRSAEPETQTDPVPAAEAT